MNPSPLIDLEGWTALVSGGAGGIGAAVVELLCAHGARALVADLPGRPVPECAEPLPCDLGDPAAIAGLEPQLAVLGTRIDLLVHCAGITADAVLWHMTDDDWNRVLRVNLDSAFHLLRLVTPNMRNAKRGRVVLISSINGERGKAGQANYAASKAGLIALARTAARELGPSGIRVNAVAPGLIETAMTEGLDPAIKQRAIAETALGRAGRSEDVARTVLYLCSDLSSHVTGQVVRVDGGQLTA